MKKLAVLGPKGTYSYIAANMLKDEYEIIFYPSILTTLMAVDDNTDALVPFENTLDGFVMESMDSIINHNFQMLEQVKLPVDFNFVSNALDISLVKNVYVQFKTYGQCLDFIADNKLTPIITQSNIESLNLLTNNNSKEFSAIIPNHINTESYNYKVSGITKSANNETRFVRVSKNKNINIVSSECDCSVAVTPLIDKPGVLFNILTQFEKNKINLRAILSRPRKDIMGKYIFYLEFSLDKDKIYILDNIKTSLEKIDTEVSILGIYNKL